MHHGVRAAEELHEVRRPDIGPRPLEPVEVEAARAPGHTDDVLDVRVGTERTDDARADVPRGSDDDDLHACLLPCRPPTETRAVCPHEPPGYPPPDGGPPPGSRRAHSRRRHSRLR